MEVTDTPGGAPIGGESESGFFTFLLDAVNRFNNPSCKAMIFTVAHRWPTRAWFVLNMYRYLLVFILGCRVEEALLMIFRERVMQLDPISMVLYALSMVSFAKHVREQVP